MASRRILRDTVVLANYIGEVNDVATFQYTTLKNVYCYSDDGVAVDNNGRRGNDSAHLYIFDTVSIGWDNNGNPRKYLPYELWRALQDKSGFWTLYDGGKDTFYKVGNPEKSYRVTSFSKLKNGSPRMWHFEVNGR